MNVDALYSYSLQGLWMTGILLLPVIVGAVAVGLMFSLVQALTQINEAALTLTLKLGVVGAIGVIVFPWMGAEFKNFFILGFGLAANV